MINFAVTLLSGGLDSTTVTAYAKSRSDKLTAITFKYGQAHSKEVETSMVVSKMLNINQKILDLSMLRDVAWYSALTNPESFCIPKASENAECGASIPITYVPLRNTIFIALAAAYLESQVLHAIEIQGIAASNICAAVYLAPNVLDYSGYPDCRPEFIERISETIRCGSKLGTEYGTNIEIETPIINMSKAEISKMGIHLGAPLEHTWSCYEGSDLPCGLCDSCILRAKGFDEIGMRDPLFERLGIG